MPQSRERESNFERISLEDLEANAMLIFVFELDILKPT